MVTKGEEVYCNRCEAHMGTIIDGEFQAIPDIHKGGYLRLQVHDMFEVVKKFEGDYCPPCSIVVQGYMREMKIFRGGLPNSEGWDMSDPIGMLEKWDDERPELVSIPLGGRELKLYETSKVDSFLSKIKKELEAWSKFQEELETKGIIEYTGDPEVPWIYGPSVDIETLEKRIERLLRLNSIEKQNVTDRDHVIQAIKTWGKKFEELGLPTNAWNEFDEILGVEEE